MTSHTCARGGCTGSTKLTFCSKRCAALHRVRSGLHLEKNILHPAIRAKALHKAGIVTAERRRKAKLLATVAQMGEEIPARIKATFEPEQIAAVKAIAARAYIQGRLDGYRAGLHKARKGEAA